MLARVMAHPELQPWFKARVLCWYHQRGRGGKHSCRPAV